MKLTALAPNQTLIEVNDVLIFFSYNTPVAAKIKGKCYRTSEKHSVTTSKHINAWLDGSPCEQRPQSWFDELPKADSDCLNALKVAQATIERLERHAPGSAIGTLDVIKAALATSTRATSSESTAKDELPNPNAGVEPAYPKGRWTT